MKLNLFKPIDFYNIQWEGTSVSEYLAILANKILNDYIESLPLIYGNTLENNMDRWLPIRESFSVNQARLICIELIEKKECEHMMIHYKYSNSNPVTTGVCMNCHKKLKAVWLVDE